MIHLLLAVIYVSFISLGLPDSLLGAAWPSIYQGLRVPVSYSGVIFCIISVGTVISSLQSDRLTRKFGADDPPVWSRRCYSHQRGHDGGGAVRLLRQQFVLGFVPVGHSLRPRCRERGYGPQQLRGAPLRQPPHELAPLHVGHRCLSRAVHHGGCLDARRRVADGLPYHQRDAGGTVDDYRSASRSGRPKRLRTQGSRKRPPQRL